MTVIQAEVPLREMADYALQLRQMTQGEGVFRITPRCISSCRRIWWLKLLHLHQNDVTF